MNFYLTGFMGVGKTTIGRSLAQILDLPFIDLDELIETQEGKSISQIFAEQGEEEFRAIESKLLMKTLKLKEQTVVALGGGTICTDKHIQLVTQKALLIYLHKDWDDIETYITTLVDRPLAVNKSMSELRELYIKRVPYYEQSQLKMPIDTTFEAKNIANRLKILTNR